MKKLSVLIGVVFLACNQQVPDSNVNSDYGVPAAMQFEMLRLVDPATGEVPSHKKMELMIQYAKRSVHKTARIYPNSWTSVDDQFASLSISRLVYDPNDVNTYYFSTGEGWGNADAARGAGVWKSTDGGETWNQLDSTANSNFYYCQDLLINPQNSDVYVSTRANGIMRSQDGGETWIQVLGLDNGSSTNLGTDLEIGPDGTLYACLGIFDDDGIYRSPTGDPGSWTKITSGMVGADFNRIEMATCPSDPDRLYAVRVRSSDRKIDSVYRSDNKGDSWYTVSLPGGDRNFAREQGWYDLIAKVDPNDEDVVVLGGLNIWRSKDGGANWTQLTDGSRHRDGSLPDVHVDQHEVYFISSDTVLFGNDGGIYISENFTDDKPQFRSINTNFNVTQYYAVDIDPAGAEVRVLGGTQDNGANISVSTAHYDFDKVSFADGAFCAIDYEQPQFIYTTTQNRRIFRIANGNFDTLTNDQLVNDNTLFINPMIMDVNDPTKLYQASNLGVWRLDNARTASRTDWVRCTRAFGQITSLAVSKSQPNLLMFGRVNSGVPYRVLDAHITDENYIPQVMDRNSELPNAYLNCVIIDPTNAAHVVIVYTNYGVNSVYETFNALDNDPAWRSCEGNLPDLPVRWGIFFKGSSSIMILATELGLFYTMELDGDNTLWQRVDDVLPNIRVDMIQYQEVDDLLVIGTHGRGIYTSEVDRVGAELQFTFKERGPGNVGGRTRTLMIDPNDPSGKRLWAGSVSGGLWFVNNMDSLNGVTSTTYLI